ncbi:hypothetical protein CPB86DRAFT_814605 [Serendipita vermifera]|nr:hypothetical protein CPB86DRAFT_814605 [Serendipita vermifera]
MTTTLPNDPPTPLSTPISSSPLISQSTTDSASSIASSTSHGPSISIETSKSPLGGTNQGPILIGLILGVALLIGIGLLVCLLVCRRRRRRRQHRGTDSISDTQNLIPTDSKDEKTSMLHGARHDIENPPPAHLGKITNNPVFPRLRTLQLVSMSSFIKPSSKSPTPTAKPQAETTTTVPRSYAIQPYISPLPFSSILYQDNVSRSQQAPSRRVTSTSTLPEGFESFIYSLRSPQSKDTSAKHSSQTSFAPTVKFARDSVGWALRRESGASVATVFDESQQKSPSSIEVEGDKIFNLLKSPESPDQPNRPPVFRDPPSSPYKRGRYVAIPEVPEDISYPITPLAPPPAHLRARSPSRSMLQRSDSNGSNFSRETCESPRVTRRNPEIRLILPSTPSSIDMSGANTNGSRSILQAAVLHGKISQEEVESVTGIPLKL